MLLRAVNGLQLILYTTIIQPAICYQTRLFIDFILNIIQKLRFFILLFPSYQNQIIKFNYSNTAFQKAYSQKKQSVTSKKLLKLC
jgi:hypothetical protein